MKVVNEGYHVSVSWKLRKTPEGRENYKAYKAAREAAKLGDRYKTREEAEAARPLLQKLADQHGAGELRIEQFAMISLL